jgi:hypothetical protein
VGRRHQRRRWAAKHSPINSTMAGWRSGLSPKQHTINATQVPVMLASRRRSASSIADPSASASNDRPKGPVSTNA